MSNPQTEKVHCKRCNSLQKAETIWVKFWKKRDQIDTLFRCQNCLTTQVKKEVFKKP